MKCSTRLMGLAILAVPLSPQAQVVPPPQPHATSEIMEIVLEKKTGDVVQAMDAGHIFKTGDVLRIRLRPAVGGYLYVTDVGSSNKSSLLFPSQETGADNRIDRAREYVVPATPNGWFEVSGPSGYDTLYFVMSPVALGNSVGPGNLHTPGEGIPQGTAPSSMLPRCNDQIFKARGECIDDMAGPRKVDPGATLPPAVRDLLQGAPAGGAARDLEFTKKSSSSVVNAVNPMTGPLVYRFLLAHN